MKCLVVVAHPLKESLCHYLTAKAIEHLEAKDYTVTVLDLYENKFSPSLTAQERRSYYQPDFYDASLKQEILQLKKAESLVLVFPTWWFGFPAVLKGWFDRVWAPGHAYNHASDLGTITPCLDNLKEVKVITTLGSPWWIDKLVLWQPVKRVLKIAILGACTEGCKFKMLSLYKSESASNSMVESFVNRMKATF